MCEVYQYFNFCFNRLGQIFASTLMRRCWHKLALQRIAVCCCICWCSYFELSLNDLVHGTLSHCCLIVCLLVLMNCDLMGHTWDVMWCHITMWMNTGFLITCLLVVCSVKWGVCVCVCVCLSICLSVSACLHVCVSVCRCMCVSMCVYMCVSACVCVCLCV